MGALDGVYDQYGTKWIVEKSDPGASVVRRLKALGFRWIVLPASVLMSGDGSRGEYIQGALGLPSNQVLRSIRYNDCLMALKGKEERKESDDNGTETI